MLMPLSRGVMWGYSPELGTLKPTPTPEALCSAALAALAATEPIQPARPSLIGSCELCSLWRPHLFWPPRYKGLLGPDHWGDKKGWELCRTGLEPKTRTESDTLDPSLTACYLGHVPF